MSPNNSIEVSASAQEHQLLLWIKQQVDVGVTDLQQGNAEHAVMRFKAALEKAPRDSPTQNIVRHNLLTAHKQCIEKLLEVRDYGNTNRHLRDAFTLHLSGQLATDRDFRGRFADVFYDLGKALALAREHEAALACVRRAISIEPCPSFYVDLNNALYFAKARARLDDFTRAYKTEQLGKHMFIACAPKSGSTFLKSVMISLTRFRDVFSVHAALQNEHDLDLPQLAKFGTSNTVTQQHCRATEANIHLMQAFGIRPVVLVRNIFDTVMSLRDFYTSGFTFSTFFQHDDYIGLSEDERTDLLIDHVVPWYFQFFASWQRADQERRVTVCWLTYEEMIADKAAAVERVLAFNGIAASRSDIDAAISVREGDRRGTRFNRGVAGRGQVGLTDAQRKRILNLARYFPKVDFGRLGIDRVESGPPIA